MIPNVREVTPQTLVHAVAPLKSDGYRFVTMTCTDLGDAHDILYHFDCDLALPHLRLKLPRGQPLPSISHVYFAAMLIENELQDLFGIKVQNLAVDFKGRLLLTEDAPRAPQNKALPAGPPPAADTT